MCVELVADDARELRIVSPVAAQPRLLYEVGVLQLLQDLQADGIADVAQVLRSLEVLQVFEVIQEFLVRKETSAD